MQVTWGGRAPAQFLGGNEKRAPERGAVNAMRLGVREREQDGVASVLGPPPLFPVPGPKSCVRAGDRLVSEFLRAQNLHRRWAGTVPRAGPQV